MKDVGFPVPLTHVEAEADILFQAKIYPDRIHPKLILTVALGVYHGNNAILLRQWIDVVNIVKIIIQSDFSVENIERKPCSG